MSLRALAGCAARAQRRLLCAAADKAPTGGASATPRPPNAMPSAEAKAAKAKGLEEATAKVTAVEGPAVLPDVPSTSLGFVEDPAANDPLKWKKFAWKYGASVAVFFVSYQALHWYVGKIETDGKRKRREMEENKTLVNETPADWAREKEIANAKAAEKAAEKAGAKAAAATPLLQPAAGLVEAEADPAASRANADTVVAADAPESSPVDAPAGVSEEPKKGPVLFSPVTDETVVLSELEELTVFRAELDAKLKQLRMQKVRTAENDAEKLAIKRELKDVASEIAILASKEADKLRKNAA